MSYAPPSIRAVAALWESKGGVPLGIVGDTRHVRGYHLGRDRIYAPGGEGDRDYSIQTPCDKRGLTDAASAIDLGRLYGSLADLQRFSRWLVERCRAGAPGTDQIREVIYSPDGRLVLRWDRERGVSSAPRAGEADDTHRYHTHISFYRCFEQQDKTAIFAPFFEAEETTMPIVQYKPERWQVPKGTPFYDAPGGKQIGKFSNDATITTFGAPYNESGTVNWAYRIGLVLTAAVDKTSTQKLVWVPRQNLTYVGPANLADCTEAVTAERNRWTTWLLTAPKDG
jgi:hypothetical protein